MFTSRSLFAALLAFGSLTACVVDDTESPDDTESFEETSSALSSSSWTGPGDGSTHSNFSYPPAMAMLNDVEYFVYGWGEIVNPFADLSHDLYWHQCDGTTCTSSRRIPGQLSMDRVSLAAFNGYIYMVHRGDSDAAAVWFSRLDTTTGEWSTNIKLPVETFGGSPALAAFNNRLYMVGSRQAEVTRHGVPVTTYPLWYATMGADEKWSASRPVGSESASPPSLAVLGSRLYLAHRHGASADIVLQSIPVGGGWTAPARIPAGPSNAYIEGDDVQLAAVNGYLHLVHHRFTGNLTYWTYNRGCDEWAPEVSVDAFSSSSRSSLATGRNGLVLSRLVDVSLPPYTQYSWYKTWFIAPPAPMTMPNCGAQS